MVIPLPQFGSDGNTAEDGEGGVRVWWLQSLKEIKDQGFLKE
jgi:hypothetical protein